MVFFSSALPRPPSAAEPLTPPVGVPGQPTGRPGPQPGPGPGLLGDVPGFFRSMVAWGVRAGPGLGPGPGPVPGPGRALGRLALRGFRRQAGGAAAGLPDFGTPGSAHTVLTRTGHSVAVSALLWCVCCLDERARASRSRPGEGVLPRRLRAALWEPCGAARLWAAPGSGPPFSLLRAVRWPGPGPGRRLPSSSPAGAAGRD